MMKTDASFLSLGFFVMVASAQQSLPLESRSNAVVGASDYAAYDDAQDAYGRSEANKPGILASNESLDSALSSDWSGVGGQEACDDCRDGGLGDWFLGLLVPSDHCYSGYISPMTNPVFFEDPRTLTEARIIYLNHRLPPGVAGDHVNLFAMQLRAALTDSLSIIATKDGFITADGPAPLDDGWADITAGLKLNLYKDPCTQTMLSAGFWYEIPIGSTKALQARGSGDFHLFLSGAKQLPWGWQWISGTGIRLPADTVDGSQMWYASNHLDHKITDVLFGFVEFNYFNWINSGGTGLGGAPTLEGNDLFNLGAANVNGNSIATGALGVKFKPNRNTEVGVAWEVPLTTRRDLLDNRLTVDWILRY